MFSSVGAWVQYAIEGAYSLISSIADTGSRVRSKYLSDCSTAATEEGLLVAALFHLRSCLFWLLHRLPQIGLLFPPPACSQTLLKFLAGKALLPACLPASQRYRMVGGDLSISNGPHPWLGGCAVSGIGSLFLVPPSGPARIKGIRRQRWSRSKQPRQHLPLP